MSSFPEDEFAEFDASAASRDHDSVDGPDPMPLPCTKSDDKFGSAQSEKTISCTSCRRRKLKCDRVKPMCGTCVRLRHECFYPERRRNTASKRRNMKDLEARLAQVEGQLVSESILSSTAPPAQQSMTPGIHPAPEADQSFYGQAMSFGNSTHNETPFGGARIEDYTQAASPDDTTSQELLQLGIEEPLPSADIMDELYQVYFDHCHAAFPIMHKYRFLASLHLPPHMRPPICLQYAMWVVAASVSDKHRNVEELLYQRARKYIDMAEMKGHGQHFVSIQHVQTWSLIATYEAKKTLFTRAWMSSGRVTRLAHMLGLHNVDDEVTDHKRILPSPRDWIEREERRRTFWGAFYNDRWASAGTGWPMTIQEHEINTNLPCSEEAFDTGVAEDTIRLSDALTATGASKVTAYGAVILSACLFGRNFEHLHHNGPLERPDDLTNGEYWKRHRELDNILSNTFMFLPDHLRLPSMLRNMNVVFFHMNIHTSIICLHQASVLTAKNHSLPAKFIEQSHSRCLMAAEEIANIMRLVSHVDVINMNTWMGFCLYVAAGVFVSDIREPVPSVQSMTNLGFIIGAMQALGRRHTITDHFTAQLEADIESGVVDHFQKRMCRDYFQKNLPKDLVQSMTPQPGIVPYSEGKNFTLEELLKFAKSPERSSESSTASPKTSGGASRGTSVNSPLNDSGIAPVSTMTFTNDTRLVSTESVYILPAQNEPGVRGPLHTSPPIASSNKYHNPDLNSTQYAIRNAPQTPTPNMFSEMNEFGAIPEWDPYASMPNDPNIDVMAGMMDEAMWARLTQPNS